MPLQGAIVVCYGGGKVAANFGGVDVVPLLGASVGCHCNVLWLGWRVDLTQKLFFSIWGLCWYNICFHCLPFQVIGFYNFLIFHICNVSPELVFSTCHFRGLTESMQAIGVGISSNLREIHMVNG